VTQLADRQILETLIQIKNVKFPHLLSGYTENNIIHNRTIFSSVIESLQINNYLAGMDDRGIGVGFPVLERYFLFPIASKGHPASRQIGPLGNAAKSYRRPITPIFYIGFGGIFF
jgi:hypothetical protein